MMQSTTARMHSSPRRAVLLLASSALSVKAQDIFLDVRVKIVEDEMPSPAFPGHHHHPHHPHHPDTITTTTTMPQIPPPSPNSTNVYMPQCELAAPGWPIFNTSDDLQSDLEWSQYFTTVYGEIPSFGYPICIGSFTQLAVRGGPQITANPQNCTVGTDESAIDGKVDDGTLIYAMTPWIEPPQNLVTHIYTSRNVRHAVPAYMWVEIQHIYSKVDMGEAWYYLEFGSAVWFNVGNTIAFEDHPDATQYFLGTECRERHRSTPHTECEADFRKWYPEARKQGYTTLQFTNHYDCGCGEEGPSSWTHNRLCHTEIVDFNALSTRGGCATDYYKAGWAAQRDCDCDSSKEYSNCKGFGL